MRSEKAQLKARAKKFFGRLLYAIVFLPLIAVALLNFWFSLGARTGLGDWSEIRGQLEREKDPNVEQKRSQVYRDLLAIVNEPKTWAAMMSVGEYYRKSAPAFVHYATSKKGKLELNLLQRVGQEKCLPVLQDLGPQLLAMPESADLSSSRHILFLLRCAALTEIWGLAVTDDSSAETRLKVYFKHLGNLSSGEEMAILQERFWYVENLAINVKELVHAAKVEPLALEKIEALFRSLPSLPADIIVSASDKYFLKPRFDEIFAYPVFVPVPTFEDFVWRSNLQVYLTVRPQLKDFQSQVSLEKMYSHRLEETGEYIGWATPQATVDGHYFFKNFLNEIAATVLVLELERFWIRTGHYPDKLSELERSDFVVAEDQFNKDGFEYKRDPALQSFTLKSLSNWHERGEATYHLAHKAQNREVEAKAANPKAATKDPSSP